MNKITFSAVILATLALTGCGQFDRDIAKFTGNPVSVCYEGVEYIQFTSGSTVAYNTDGTIKLCEDD